MPDDESSNQTPSGAPPTSAETPAGLPDPANAQAAAAEIATETVEASADAAQTVAAESARIFADAQSLLKSMDGAAGFPGMEPFNFSPNLFRSTGADVSSASHVVTDFNAAVIDAWRTNIEATVAHWQRLAGARSVSEIITLNAEFARKQMDRFATQSRDIMTLTARNSGPGK